MLAADARERDRDAICATVVVDDAQRSSTSRARSIAARDVVVLPEVGSAGASLLGMGVSIAAGVARLARLARLARPARRHAAGPSRRRCSRWRARSTTMRVAFAQYRGRRGHPVGFAAELYSELTALVGDEGARRIIARYPAFPVELDDAGILVDIDTEDDLAALRRTVPRTAPRDPCASAVAPI